MRRCGPSGAARSRSSARGLRLLAAACRVVVYRWPSWPAVALLLGVAVTAHLRSAPWHDGNERLSDGNIDACTESCDDMASISCVVALVPNGVM